MTPGEQAKLEVLGGWLAVELGKHFGTDVVFAGIWQEIQRRIGVAVAKEREACAKLVDSAVMILPGPALYDQEAMAMSLAAAIRARSLA